MIPFTVTRERETRFHLLENATVKILLTAQRDALRDFLFHDLLTKKLDYSQQNAILCLTYASYHQGSRMYMTIDNC